MKHMSNLKKLTGLAAILAAAALPAFAQDAAPAAEAVAEAVTPVVDKGDVAWMMTSSLLVLFMLVPGLALFYGGLVRTKNMLSILMQCTVIGALVMVIWVVYGYSFAFGGGTSPFWGGTAKLFLAGVTTDSTAATFSSDFELPEYVFIAFQMTFAAITPALFIGAFAERIKFSGVLLFTALWVTFVYFPVAHMVWDGAGLIFNMGAIDFAGGTVVHINAGIAALVASIVVGPRLGLGKDMMAPHSMTLTMVGAAMLWVGWFGFNAGSNLEANGGTTLAMINTFVATGAAGLGWMFAEWLTKGKPSLLGIITGAVGGLVAVTPAAGLIGPMGAIVLGAVASVICFIASTSIKNALGYDDSLDVFGVHCVGGIVGSIATGVLVSPALGGVGLDGYSMGSQVVTQTVAVVIALAWSGIGSAIIYFIVDKIVGLRVGQEKEFEGLDLSEHGERAYHY